MLPRIRTEAITHERFADPVATLQAARVDSCSIELGTFHPDDARALHDVGIAVRLHLPRPATLERGVDWKSSVSAWLEAGLVDSLSGDDVAFLAGLVSDHA